MRAVINRRIYDTEKSQLLARRPAPSFNFGGLDTQEGLYKSPNLGHLFIWKSDPDVFGESKSTIRLVSQDEALEWLIEHRLNTEEIFQKIGVKLEEA